MKIKKLNESGYKLTLEKDGKTFADYCYDYRKESAVAQMKAKYGDDIEVLDVVEHNKINESIEVATIANYITDHYKFETIDDKYSCINSIKDSFKNEKTISKEELEQFIGAHNGKDIIEEDFGFKSGSKYLGGLPSEPSDLEYGRALNKAYLDSDEFKEAKQHVIDFAEACKLDGSSCKNYTEFAEVLSDDGIIATSTLWNIYLDTLNGSINESMKDYRFEVSCNDGPTKVVKLIWDDKDVEGAKELAKKYYAQEHTTYADDRANKWVIEESLEENVQYGVHQFSTDSIIFRGTEEECGKYIDNNKNLWDDAEVYMMNPNDPHYKKDLYEASYGGAFDIADDQIFTREDIDNLAEEVLNHINETYEYKFDISAAYIDGNELEVGVENDELGEYITTLKIDMRKVKEPWHLKRVYAFEVASDLINQISRSLNGVKELEESIKNIDARTLRNALTAIHKAEEVLNDLSLDVKQELYLDNILKELNNAKVEAKDIIEDNLNNEDKNVLFSEFELDDIHLIIESDSKEIEDEIINESNTEDAEPIETGAAVGMATVLSDLIKDEYEAIDGYNTAIATAESEGFSDMIKVLTDIQAEENIHIGQLQELMKIVDPNASKIEDGTVEAEELLSNPSVNDDDDFDFEDIDESFDVSEDDIADEDVEAAIKAVEEAMKEPNKEDIDLTNTNFELEDDDEVIVESTEPWEDIYNSFKDIEVQLNGDGEAITATIDRIYNDNKGNPDFEKAYKKWADNE